MSDIMKTSYQRYVVAIAALIICLGCAVGVHAHKVKGIETVPPGFGEAYVWKKVGPHLQHLWIAAKKAGAMGQKFECFVRVQAPSSQGDENFLQSKGFNVRVFAGSLARGNVTAAKLPDVAALPFVRSIKMATSH